MIGLQYLSALSKAGSLGVFIADKFSAPYFKGDELEVFKFVDAFARDHHAIPAMDTLKAKFPTVDWPEAPEPSSFYAEQVDTRYVYTTYNTSLTEVNQLLKAKNVVEATDKLAATVHHVKASRLRHTVTDFAKDGQKQVMSAYVSHFLGENDNQPFYFGWETLDADSGGLMPGDLVSIVGRPAMGKAQPLDALVLTTTGFKPMGSVRVGDTLASVDGTPSEVTGVFPQGKKPVYRLTFQDGRTTEASDEHLWEAHYWNWPAPRIQTTLQLTQLLENPQYQHGLGVQLFSGEWGHGRTLPESPYQVGQEAHRRYQGVIPSDYLTAARGSRVALLQGLLESNGAVSPNGSVSYRSHTSDLAEQVQWVIRSLGGQATMKKTAGAYFVQVSHLDRADLVRGEVLRARINSNPSATLLDLKRIDFLGEKECQCISVSHPSHLYVTDGFTVTHNTWMLLYSARNMWRICQQDVMVLSMEMNSLAISQRLASMQAQTSIKLLKTHQMTTHQLQKVKGSFVEADGLPHRLWIVDGNLNATVEDIFALVDTLRPKALFIDGAYLLKHSNPRLDRFTRVAENAEALKAGTELLGTRTICSYQFNRDAAKKASTKGGKAGLEDIAYSDAIGQVSSLVLGLSQEDSVETKIARVVDILKGRDGQEGQFKINWDFQNMDFSEQKDPFENPDDTPNKDGAEDAIAGKQYAEMNFI